MHENEAEKELEKNKEQDAESIEEVEKESPLIFEMPESVKNVVEQQEKMRRSIVDSLIMQQYKAINAAFEPVRVAIKNAQKFVAQPHIADAIKRMQETLNVVGDVTKEDARLKKHSENPHFWKNLSRVSKELIILPQGIPDEVLDYLDTESCDAEEVKRMLAEFDVMELEKELEADEHGDYLFKAYLQEIINLHKTNPDNYRVSIPALFVIIEGTLGEIFKISEDGMASEIKQKMNVFWDIYGYVYANQFFGSAFTFWNQFYLTNTKDMFNQLTINSKEAGVKLNRNAILHGQSNPKDWSVEDFETLLNLLHTTLFLRKTADFLTKDFDAMMHDEFYDEQKLIFKEFEQAISLIKKNGEPKTFRRGDVQTLRKNLMTDLNHIFSYDETKLELILEKSNFLEIEERLLAIK
ncbi:hypothetical protein H1Q58_09635 [Planococcus maritimus]|uniref:Uncharacterized protein n=1 Tax=Planococcus maritimus TaxID=192421 RepID=A0A7D7RLV1_PLAMR|nr:hypothetical protein [Planococcus maritimus]QMT16239.1 hypothetical protein H1Q58_09635 [Planococcus maritimus]